MRAFNVLLAILVSVVMALCVFEVGLRVIGKGPPKSILEFDAHTGWRKQANAEVRRKGKEFAVTIRTNEHGLADDPMPSTQKPAGAFRVVVLGDSFTQGFTVERKDLFVDLLEHRWIAEGRAVDIVNAGTEGWSTDQEVAWLLQNGAKFQPDLVILAAYENDIYWNGQARYVDRGSAKPLFRADGSLEVATCEDIGPRPLSDRLATTRLLKPFLGRNPFLAPHLFQAEGATRPMLKEFASVLTNTPDFMQRSLEGTKGALIALKNECDKLGARALVLTIPSHSAVNPEYSSRFAAGALGGISSSAWSADKPVDTFLALAGEVGLPTLDPRSVLRDAQKTDPQYFSVDWHLNPNGNRTLAAFLHDQLDKTGALPAAFAAKTAVAADAALPPAHRDAIDWTFVAGLFGALWIVLSMIFIGTYPDENKTLAPIKVGVMLALVFTIFLGGRALLGLIPQSLAPWILGAFVVAVLGFVVYKLGRRVGTILELFKAFVLRGHWYLMPLLVVLLTIGSLLVVAASSPLIAPFIYTLF